MQRRSRRRGGKYSRLRPLRKNPKRPKSDVPAVTPGAVPYQGDWWPSNTNEGVLFRRLKGKGYRVHNKGWPDFLVERPDGSIICVEVKLDKDDHLRRRQMRVCEALARAGIPTYVWRPDTGFFRVTPREYSHRG